MNCQLGRTFGERQLTGLSDAVKLLADSSGIDSHHGDGVFSVRGQLGEQDSRLLPSNLGLVGEEYMSASVQEGRL